MDKQVAVDDLNAIRMALYVKDYSLQQVCWCLPWDGTTLQEYATPLQTEAMILWVESSVGYNLTLINM